MNIKADPDPSRMEVWGGAEYTCNRVGDSYFDQMRLSGHWDRTSDFEQFAELGIQALRCGILWERHELDRSWEKSDAYLHALRRSTMRPIAGLVHHGSGPEYTSLLDPGFARRLALYAGEVAARYPWIDAYTPVNEPNTTARFACRYGIWYPHHSSQRSYLRALVNQVQGIVLSMRAIRNVRSDAQLVQTDDLGCVRSTPELAAISDLMDERRWLAFDLLCGTVDRSHPLYDYLRDGGLSDHDIFWFSDNPCPPDIVGANYYVTSDRFLDHRVNLYSCDEFSSEGSFADIAAVRIRPEGIQGFASILREAHRRYQLPVALTEVHLGDSVEQQIRWVCQAWREASRVREAAVPCQAVTFWALLGSYFWNALVTTDNGHYEPGVFDLRYGKPNPTELAKIVRQCASGDNPDHPFLCEPGWWHRSNRIQYQLESELVS